LVAEAFAFGFAGISKFDDFCFSFGRQVFKRGNLKLKFQSEFTTLCCSVLDGFNRIIQANQIKSSIKYKS
jgi:hypothetical protein